MIQIQPHRVRDDARSLLRDMIVNGELGPDAHIEEIKLSQQIGVSRTPVREALIALEQEGLVASRPRKGFTVVRPSAALVRESFPIHAALEAAAVRLGADALRHAAPKLREINDALSRARAKARQYELDSAFHTALTEPCGNVRLLRLLAMERARLRLIDGAHAKGMANLENSCAEHASIISALEKGDAQRAAAELAMHWIQGIEVVVKWLEK